MSAAAAWALQQAIIAGLKADTNLLNLLGEDRIYDAVPSRAAYPYVAYGPVSLRDWSSGSGAGQEHFVSLSAYSRQPGFREAYAIIGAIEASLEGASLALDDHKLVLLRFDTAEFRREPDPLTSRGLVVFRALTEKL